MMLQIALIILAAIANVYMDLSSEGHFKINWMDKETSWMNKWKLGGTVPNDKRPWYYFGLYKPKLKEKFPFSSTILVFLTDFWHFAQFIFHSSWQMALAIQFDRWFIAFLMIKVTFSVTFELLYKSFKK